LTGIDAGCRRAILCGDGRRRARRPVGFADIRLTFELDSDAPQEKLDRLLKLTERYCVVLQTLKRPPTIEAKLVRART
jgi:uncharacterized OsmC-like protein